MKKSVKWTMEKRERNYALSEVGLGAFVVNL